MEDEAEYQHPLANALLDETALADRWKWSVKTLRNKRVTGGFIPFVKISRSVRYRLSDIIAWEEAHLHRSTSEGGSDA